MKLWKDTFGHAQSRWQLAGWLLAFAFPVLALVVDKAASTIYAIFFLAGLWLLVRRRVERPDPLMQWVLVAFTAYFVVGVLSFFLGEQTRLGEKLLGRDIRFFGAVLCFAVVSMATLPPRLLRLSFIVAGVVTGGGSLIEVIADESGHTRASGETIAILFGHLSAASAMITATFALDSSGRRHISVWLGFLGFMTAVILSGTRGALVSILVVLAWLVVRWVARSAASSLRKTLIISGVTVLTAVAALLYSASDRATLLANEFGRIISSNSQLGEVAWPEPPACLNSRNFLEWYLDASEFQGRGEIRASITNADGLAAFGCSHDFAIHLENVSQHSLGWMYAPARSIPFNNEPRGEIIAKGNAQISMGDTPPEQREEFDTEGFARLKVVAAGANDPRFLVILEPDKEIKFVPFITVTGEYEFSWTISSIGARLAMWKSAIAAFRAAPILGRGAGSFPVSVGNFVAEGKVSPTIEKFDHAHNEILNVAAERGILGLLTLFGVYAAPFWLFYRRRDAFGLAGMAFVASIFLSGLTETIFNHSLGITYYCMLILLLASAPREAVDGREKSAITTTNNA